MMSVPCPGDPKIDDEGKALIAALDRFSSKKMNNMSFTLLGELVEKSGIVFSRANRHYGIAGQRKVGGHKGAARSKK